MNKHEIYEIFERHEHEVGQWNDRINIDILTKLNKQGYVDPIAFAIFYNFNNKRYSETVIDINSDALLTEESRKINLQLLRSVEFAVSLELIAFKFAAEGSVNVINSEEKVSFLMLTYETKISGKKHVYSMDKTSYVNKSGSTSLKINRITYEEKISKTHAIKLLEEFAHILRPNWIDKQITEYN